MTYLFNYLIATIIVAYGVLVFFTLKVWLSTEQSKIPPKGSKAWMIYTHGEIWFHALWIACAVALGSLLIQWVKFNLGGM